MIQIFLVDDHQLVRQGFIEILKYQDDLKVVGEAGALGYLSKSCNREELIEAIYEAMKNESYTNSSIRKLLLKNAIKCIRKEKKISNSLSEKDENILQLISSGKTFEEIRKILNPSINTIGLQWQKTTTKYHLEDISELGKYVNYFK